MGDTGAEVWGAVEVLRVEEAEAMGAVEVVGADLGVVVGPVLDGTADFGGADFGSNRTSSTFGGRGRLKQLK